MGWLAIALGGLVLVVGALFALHRLRRRRIDAAAAEAAPAVVGAPRRRPETALSELRDLRDALGSATHTRVERRRAPDPGAVPKVERRKKKTPRVL